MASTLQTGDIAIIGINMDDPDKLTFVVLTNIDANTQIKFTDNGVTDQGTLKDNEGTWTWTATNSVAAGTVITLNSDMTATTGTLTKSGAFALSTSGDQILAYQGDKTAPNYLYAVNVKGTAWQPDSLDTNSSALPPGLNNGTTAVALVEKDNVVYSGTTLGNKAALLSAISNPANWTGDDSPNLTHATTNFAVTAGVDSQAPTLVSSNPTDESTGFGSTSNIVLNFNETIKVGTGQIVLKDQAGNTVETYNTTDSNITVNGQTLTINPISDLTASASYTIEMTTGAVTDLAGNAWQTNFGTTTPNTLNFTVAAADAPPPVTTQTYTLIHDIQGVGDTGSQAYLNKSVTINAVITAYVPNLKGFYVQEQTTDYDINPETSEGIFVYYGTTNPGVTMSSIGDTVTLTGLVNEYYKNTQITYKQGFTVEKDGDISNLPAPTVITLPTADAFNWESVEGMYVKVKSATDNGSLVVTDNYDLARYGEITLTSDKVQEQYAVSHTPSVEGYTAYLNEIAHDRIILDDANTAQNPSTLIFGRNGQPLSADNTLRGGDSISEINGVVTYANNNYKIQPIDSQGYNFTGEARPAAESIQATTKNAEITVATANVLNLFTTFGTANFRTPMGNTMQGRGADNQAEFDMQLAKVVANLSGLNADVVGLMEIQNNGFGDGSAIKTLVDALNAKMGAGTYDYIKGPFSDGVGHVATAGSDAIMVGMIYKPSKVTPVGEAVVPNTTDYPAFATANRVPLAQAFKSNLDGEIFTTVVNHFKSKGSVIDADLGDGQGNNAATRLEAAKQLKSWLDTDPTHSKDKDNLLIGDFNAYDKEDSLQYLENNGYDVQKEAYSYVFDGLWGSLDHAISSESLSSQITSVTTWAINAQESTVYDYNTNFKSAQTQTLIQPDQYRSSDHNPLLIGLNLSSTSTAPVEPTTPISHDTPINSTNTVTGTEKGEVSNGTMANDLFISSKGNDVINGGLGNDTLDYSNQLAAINAMLNKQQVTGTGFNHRVLSIENIIGTQYDDNITGNDYANILKGGNGNDTLNGGKGNDILQGDLGNDKYIFDANFGSDNILDFDKTAGNTDTITFTTLGINDLSFSREGDNLKVTQKSDSNNSININHWYQDNGAFVIEKWQMADGQVFDASMIAARVI